MSKETFPHLEALRDLMRSKHIDAAIIPGTDPHRVNIRVSIGNFVTM